MLSYNRRKELRKEIQVSRISKKIKKLVDKIKIICYNKYVINKKYLKKEMRYLLWKRD